MMDVHEVTVTIDGQDTVISLFKAGDHEKIDAYMGIEGIANSRVLSTEELNSPILGIEYHPGAVGQLDGNVEFDKQKFAAYANAVTLAKMLLLQETNPLGGPATVGSGQLSELMSDYLTQINGVPTSYDWGLLNPVGDHGGNILTTTLPKPVSSKPFAVAGATDTITIVNHGFSHGEAVRYDAAGSPVGGLVDTAGYFVQVIDANTIKLHRIYDEAEKHVNAVALTSPGSGTLTTAIMVDYFASATETASSRTRSRLTPGGEARSASASVCSR